MLYSDRQPDISVGDTGPELFFRRQLRVSRGRRMNRKRSRIADVGYVVEHLQRIDEPSPGVKSALELKAEQAAEPSLEIGLGAPPGLSFHCAREDHLCHLRMFGQIGCSRVGICTMLSHPQRQRFEALD